MFSFVMKVKSRTGASLTDEHFVGRMRIATTEIKPHTETANMQKQYQILTND
jgi:hypothetical protein